ncbi:hypothetical protein QJS10_CPA16g00343 [Acorus calamus]|uniref:RRM domain-containing protein n=1 Tax=Acorus calamus TaxID=4465 RepID=A0AAV9D395_ACOCL|nr:hypothetical protein QJS10_CPA16g00343 [Acorus calamus]
MASPSATLFKPSICLATALSSSKPHLLSLPSTPTPTKPFLRFSLRPTTDLSLSLPKTRPSFAAPLVAGTSDSARQEEENEASQEGFDWDGEGKSLEGETELSDWDGEGEVSDDGGAVAEAVEEEEVVEGEESYVEPPEEAKLFVGNIPYDLDSESLAQLFDRAGVVEVAEVIYNRETDQSRGFGFVTMSTVEEAEKAVEIFHRYEVNGRLLTVNKAAPRGSQPERAPRSFEPSFRIYVGNLPWQVDDARLEQVFSEHGKVVEARVVYDRDTGRSRGFGFVSMASQTELDDAIAALDGQNLDGRALRVNVAEERRRSAF